MTLLTIWNYDTNEIVLNDNYSNEAGARSAARLQLSNNEGTTLRVKITNNSGLDQDVLVKDNQIVGATHLLEKS